MSARIALVASASGTSARKRCASVRASSQSTKASKRSDLPPWARKRALAALTWFGMQGQHGEAGIEQALDEQPVGALERHSLHTVVEQEAAERDDALLVVGNHPLRERLSALVGNKQRVLVLGPVHSSVGAHGRSSSVEVLSDGEADREVPLRVLTERRSEAPRPVAASGASHRRGAQVSCGPSAGQAIEALPRRWSAPARTYRPREREDDQ